MKRSYTYLKGLLTLALAAFTGWMWAAGESISIKLNAGTFDANTNYGCYPVKGADWQVVGGGAKVDNIALKNNVKVSYTSSAEWAMSWSKLSAHVLLDAYLDDGTVDGHGTEITVSGLDTTTFANYDVLIYMTADTTPSVGHDFVAPTVNGTRYTLGGAGDANWGTKDSPHEPRIGINCLLVKGLQATADSNTLTISVPAITSRDAGRASISAIQIVQSGSVTSTVFDSAVSEWTFENSTVDLRGKLAGWSGNNDTTNAFVESLRKNASGEPYIAAKMSEALHPWANGYVWPDQVTIAVYANLENCPDNGALVSSGGATRLRKLDADTIFFGKNTNVTADLETLSKGYHLIIASRDVTNRKLTLQIDNGTPVVVNDISNISDGIQLGADWAGGTHSYTANGGAIFDDVLIWDKILTSEEIAQLVAAYPAVIPSTAEAEPTGVGPHKLSTLIENGLTTGADIVATITLADGATLEIDTAATFNKLNVVSDGSVTIKVTDLAISQAQLDEMKLNTEGVKGDVTNGYDENVPYTKDDVTYPLVYRGDVDGWTTTSNWYTGARTNGTDTYWIPYSNTVVPGAPNPPQGQEVWNVGLIDGSLIGDKITADAETGYKVVNTPLLEGWALKIAVANGVHVKIPSLKKLQGGCIIRVDDSSKVTVTDKANPGDSSAANEYYIDAENGLEFVNMSMPAGTAYLGVKGSIKVGTFDTSDGPQTIGGVTLDLGDTSLTGRKVITRTLYTYTSGTTTSFTVADGAVTTNVEGKAATEAVSLRNVGDYKFVKTDTSYAVQYVAYAATDEIGEASTWTATDGTAWSTEANWTWGVPEAGDDAVISITANTTITIPAEGVTVGVLTVNGDGTLTIAGGKITAGMILANTSIAADEATLALAPMNIAAGKTVTYTTTTTEVDADRVNNVNHALSLKAMTGAGTFVKKGTGVIGLFATAAEPAIVIEEGAIYVREAPTTAMNIAAKAGAEIRLAAWHVNFANTANKITLDGGAQLTLANGANVSGTITIANAAETAAKICGSSFNASTIAAAITGAGKVEFADGGSFADATKFPCTFATTYSGVISGELQVIISDTSAVTFTGANTYTGGTVIAEGVTVSVSNTNTIFGTGNVTGAGTVKIAGGTYNDLSLAQYTDANTTIVIPADNTVTGYFNNATWTCAAKIQLDGTLSLTNGYGAGKYTFTGPWTGAGSFSLSHANPADVVRITGDISGFTGNISVAGARALTFCAATTGTNQKYSGKICVHGDYAYTAKVNGTWSAPVMVENGAKIGGTGTIDNTITFNDGAIIDTSVTATGDVTLNGTVTVSGEAGATVLTCANAESLDLTKFAAPTGLRCIAENGAVKLAVAKVNVTIPAAPTNTKWYDADGNEVEAGTIAVDPNADVILTLKADEGYVFADGTTEVEVTVNAGENGATVETPDVTAAAAGAKIGDKLYTSFAAAFAAAEEGDTITLLAGVTITSRLDIAQNVTIDLNGQTIAETMEDQFGAIYVKKGATLTIEATNGGEITTDGGIVIGNYGTVVVNGGTIAAGEEPEADVSIYNFYYQADWYGTTTINGGTVARIWNCGVATLAGGTITDVDNSGAMEIAEEATVTNVLLRDGTDAPGIEGAGTLKAAADLTVTTEEGYKAVYDAETGTWTAIDPSIGKAAKIGDEYYDTFLGENGALAAAVAGQTITLLADVEASEIITIEKAITLDGNGKILTSTATRAINVDCDGAVTIQNLTIDAAERAINIINKAATVTINGVTATADNNAVMIATSAGAAEVSIIGCNFTGLSVVGVYGASADVTIANSTIANVDANDEENYGAITVGNTADNATVDVTNTTITVMDDSKKVYNFAPTATVTGVDEDEVGVIVAMIGDAGYDTIEEAAGDVQAGQTIVLVTDVSTSTPLAIAGTIDLNGKTLTADIAGTIKMNGGTFATSQYTMVGADGKYTSTDAVFTIAANATYDMTVTEGTLTLNEAQWWTLEGQTITIGENAAIVIPAGKTLGINGSTIVVNGTATVAGEVQLLTKTSTVKAAADLNVTTTVAGCEVKYIEGVYTVVESIVIEDVIAKTPAAEAIKAAMELAGVTEIESYTITTKGAADTGAEADEVAAVLEVFEVTPEVDANGVLSVAYEFGISAMTNEGEVISITAGVTGAEYRAGVEVAFYADGVEIGTATTTADSTTVSITNIQASDISGKKITVKATK